MTTTTAPVTVRASVSCAYPDPNTPESPWLIQWHGVTTLQSNVTEAIRTMSSVDRALVDAHADAKDRSRAHGVAIVMLSQFTCDGTLMHIPSDRVVCAYVGGMKLPIYTDAMPQHLANLYRRGDF